MIVLGTVNMRFAAQSTGKRSLLCLRWIVMTGVALVVTLSAEAAVPQRIVSLKPNITEILFALGAGDRVVGVTTWCTYPPEALVLPRVADYVAPNIEKTVALSPDLVLGSQENAARQPIERLQKMGINVVLLPFATPDATWGSIQGIGELLGTPAAGKNMADRLRFAIGLQERAWAMFDGPRVLIVVGSAPLIAAGPSSLIGNALQLANGENIVTATKIAYPRISKETIIEKGPDIIIDASDGMGEPTHTFKDLYGKEARHISIDLFRPGPRFVTGVQALGEAIHGVTH